MKTREQLDELLLDLEDRLPELLIRFSTEERLRKFASEAGTISDVAGPDDWEYVRHRIHSMSAAYGLDQPYRYFGAPNRLSVT